MKKLILIIILLIFECNNPSLPSSASSQDNKVKVLDLQKSNGMVLIPAKDSVFKIFDTVNTTITLTHDFWIDTTEIPQKMYSDIMKSAYSWFKTPDYWAKYQSGDLYPAYGVTWFQAVLFCNARSKLTGLDTAYKYDSLSYELCLDTCMKIKGLITDFSSNGYRLPTEAEWMYACRGTSKDDYFWGNDTSLATLYCCYQRNSRNKVSEIGKKFPNQFGLYDMLGNLDEYCNDFYDVYLSTNMVDPNGPKNGEFIVVHGGAFYQSTKYISFSYRQKTNPESSTNYTGFRNVIMSK